MDNYTVLARKYRSQNFQDLIGQDVLVKTLTAAISTGRIAHAYILTGIRGTGKTSTARILAKALNCAASDMPTATPCGTCDNCRAIAAGQFIDVIEIDAASHTGVDDVRDNILDAVQYRPTNGRYKVYIIDEVHMLSASAFNALLKTLEEPPEYVIFILATTEIHKVPITILSRCQRFDLARVPVETLKKHFLSIAAGEKAELSDIAADLIARAADGSVRDGLSILDQAIAQTGGKVTDESVMSMLRRADRQMVSDMMKIILAGDTEAALKKSDEVYQAGSDVTLVLNDMLEWTHWATRGKIAPMSMENAPYTPDQKQQMREIADGATLNTLSRIWQVMVSANGEMKAAGNPKQNFDMMIIRMINISELPPVSQILETRDKRQETSNIASEPRATNHEPRFSSATDLSAAMSAEKELTLLAEWNGNCEIIDFSDGKIKMHYRGEDGTFAMNLSAYLQKKTGRQWEIELAATENKMTVGETRNEEIRGDPLVADALNLFADATVMSVK
ncbi:MAG: DNA polymerase III subunit gamma/tau [Rickettsiales bacterium]|jgi:DNA polymerase-3 subunit gamma/tau|nr:DNA polymerase III subunit gamma/tau [Rickettsiales bacterium]